MHTNICRPIKHTKEFIFAGINHLVQMKGYFKVKAALERYPFFLITIPFVYLIHVANYYFRLLHWGYIVVDILIYLIVPVVLYIILGKLWRSYAKAGTLLCISLIVFYFFHLLYDWLNSTSSFSFLARYSILLPMLLMGMILLVIYIHRRTKGFYSFYYISNLIFLLLLAGGLYQYIVLSINNPVTNYDQADPQKKLSKSYTPCDTCKKPDIYFLLFDGYTNTNTLKKEFGYDNTFIENKLQQDSFYIPSHSNSNYNFTHMSLGSELNLAYLANLDNDHRFYTKDFFEANYTIYYNELCDILRKEGYEINNYSIFDINDAPVKITPALTQLTWRSVLGQTFFNKLKRDIGWHFFGLFPKDYMPPSKRKKINEDIKRINETVAGIISSTKKESANPQFVYAHFLMPHETYYFDSSGKRLNMLYTAKTLINPTDYVNQVVYTNKFILRPVIDSIFRNVKKPFIIIIQGDHGYRNYPPDKVMLEFENLSAVYFPDKEYSAFNDSLSSVNTFRIILNKYFNQSLPLLKDSTINLYKHNSY